MLTRITLFGLVAFLAVSCNRDHNAPVVDTAAVESAIFAVNDAQVEAMVAGESTAAYSTSSWSGVNLNGTPMDASGFEGEDRVMVYNRIEILERNVRVYGDVAALRWHANFHVTVNGNPSFAEMRLLDVYVLEDGQWKKDLTQVTPVYGTVGNPPGE